MIWIYKGKQWDTVLYKDLQDKLDDGWSTKKPEAEPEPKKRRRKPKNDNSNTD